MNTIVDNTVQAEKKRGIIAKVLETALFKACAQKFTHKHLKRGSFYHEVATGSVQSSRPIIEGDRLTIYLAEDGTWWLRPVDEFNDGRFEKLKPDR